MAKTIPFRLITPQAIAFEGEAELVIAVGTEGEEGIAIRTRKRSGSGRVVSLARLGKKQGMVRGERVGEP